MAERLAGGNVAVALSQYPGAGDCRASSCLRPISALHFNPAVTLADAALGDRWRDVPGYVLAQVAGAFAGRSRPRMFGETVFTASRHARAAARSS